MSLPWRCADFTADSVIFFCVNREREKVEEGQKEIFVRDSALEREREREGDECERATRARGRENKWGRASPSESERDRQLSQVFVHQTVLFFVRCAPVYWAILGHLNTHNNSKLNGDTITLQLHVLGLARVLVHTDSSWAYVTHSCQPCFPGKHMCFFRNMIWSQNKSCSLCAYACMSVYVQLVSALYSWCSYFNRHSECRSKCFFAICPC